MRTATRNRVSKLTGLASLIAAALFGGAAAEIVQAEGLIAAGAYHSCFVIDGGVQCTGNNSAGQLGTGTSDDSVVPVIAEGLGFGVGATAVAVGYSHTCAVLNEGLQCWGYNGKGQLGSGDLESSTTALQIFAANSGVTDVATGVGHTCAVIDGGLKCWGDNSSGQLGTGDTTPSTTAQTVFAAGSGVTAVAAGLYHTCATLDGGLMCWGDHGAGQLGIGDELGDETLSLVPVETFAAGSGIKSVSAKYMHTCVSTDLGQASCWGFNGGGQLGDGTAMSSATPLPVAGLSGVAAITAGGMHTCAILDIGVTCWGQNKVGQLGNGSVDDAASPTPVTAIGPDVVALAAGQTNTCAMLAGGETYCWGNDNYGQLGDGGVPVNASQPQPSANLDDMHDIVAGSNHACGVTNGNAYCWGANTTGQLGNGTAADSALPVQLDFPGTDAVVSVGAGESHGCAVVGDAVYCWGWNEYGQLGAGSQDAFSLTPVATGLAGASHVAGGFHHTCAVLANGGAKCWGRGTEGQLGNDVFADSSAPATVKVSSGGVALSNVTEISAGEGHSCAVANGGAYCWGANYEGQLGNGTSTFSAKAVPVTGLDTDVVAIATGASHSCAVSGDEVACWGYNGLGQLGDGTTNDSSTAHAVHTDAQNTLTQASAVATGWYHSCAVADGGVMCWGDNDFGQLGNGSFEDSSYAVTALPPGSGVTEVTAGYGYTCASSGLLTWCWGTAYNGRFGNGELGYSTTPVLTGSGAAAPPSSEHQAALGHHRRHADRSATRESRTDRPARQAASSVTR